MQCGYEEGRKSGKKSDINKTFAFGFHFFNFFFTFRNRFTFRLKLSTFQLLSHSIEGYTGRLCVWSCLPMEDLKLPTSSLTAQILKLLGIASSGRPG